MEIEKFLQSSPTFTMIQAAQQISSSIHVRLKQENLNFLQSLILISIFFEESKSVRPNELVTVFETSKGNISHALSRLEELKLIKRSVTKDDHRGFAIALSAQGSKKVVSLIEYFDSLQMKIEKEVGEKKLSDFNQTSDLIKECHKEPSS